MRSQIRKLLLAAIVSGLSLTAAVGLLGTSAWLISMASTQPPILVLEVAIVGVRFFGLSRGALKYSSRIMEHNAALKIQTLLRIKVYENLSNLSPLNFTKLKRGNLLSQIVGDIELSQDLWLRIVSPWLSALIAGVSGIGIIYWLSPQTGNAIALIFIVSIFLIPFLATLNAKTFKSRNHEAELFSQVMQISESTREALIFGYRDQLLENLELEEDSLAVIERNGANKSGLSNLSYFLLVGLSTITSIYFASSEFTSHHLAGINIAVLALLPLIIFEGISALPGAFSNLFQILEARRNVQGLTTTSEQESEFIMNPLATEVNIEFKDVVPVIDGIHLPAFSAKLEVGQTLVISGRSGIGKSSLISALLGFLPYTGEILINGELLNSKHQSLFTALLQDDYLFTTSIRENLKIGNPKASDRDLMQMLEIVELAELVHKLPVGLDTHIGSMGYNFSGGEKQRFKLARLLLRNTPCFILDEPYEFLDKFQADRIAKRIANVLHGKTVLIISHLQIPIVADFFVLNQEIN